MTFALCFLLSLSIAASVFLVFALKKAQKLPVPTQDAKDLLASLMQGQAILRIQVLDPESLILRSPRR